MKTIKWDENSQAQHDTKKQELFDDGIKLSEEYTELLDENYVSGGVEKGTVG